MQRIVDRTTGAIIGALALGLIAVLAGIVEAGPLDPPGPPASTDSVKLPGTPISSLPFTISAPGHYYVTRDLTASGAGVDGITVSAFNVTIDLGGFTIHGLTGTDDGITVGNFSNVSIRNGGLEGWDGDGIALTTLTNTGIIEDITVKFVGGVGIAGGLDYLIRDCAVADANGDGILVRSNSIVSNCESTSNGGDGIRQETGSVGVQVLDSVANENSGDGIQVGGAARVYGNLTRSNGFSAADGAGIHVTGNPSHIENNWAGGNDRGIDVDVGSVTIVRNTVAGNTTNFDVVANNALGPIVSAATIGASTNPHANYTP